VYLEDKKPFIYHNGTYSVANATRHLKTKHPSQHTEYKDAINHAKDVADVEARLASPPVKTKSRQTQMEDHAVPSSVKLTK
jgi:hypothetical protein